MRVVVDVNVFVAALISRTGAPARLVELWLAGKFEIVASEALLAELEQALAYPKIRARVAAADADEFVRVLRAVAEIVPDPEAAPAVRSTDPSDDYLLALAVDEDALLVSGDSHLLSLGPGTHVVSPREFLAQLGQD